MRRWRRPALLAFALALAGLAFAGPAARGEDWPLLGFYGLWGNLGLGEEVEYHRVGGEAEWKAGLSRLLSLSASGFSFHPRFLSWDASAALSWGLEAEVQSAGGRIDLLPRHSVPTSILFQRSQQQQGGRDFRPLRRVAVDSLEAQSLLGAYGDPIFLTWSTTETRLADPRNPRHDLVRNWSVGTKKRLNRDSDVTCRRENLTATDLQSGAVADRESTIAKLESRFLYDLVTLRSAYSEARETGRLTTGLKRVAEELSLQQRADWSSKILLTGEETRRDDKLTTRAEGGVQTGGALGGGWRVSLDGKASVTESGGVTGRGLDTGLSLGWDGGFGPLRLSTSAGFGWRPERGEGRQVVPVRGEPSQLWVNPLTDPGARPLANHQVRLAALEVFLPRELKPLVRGVDYDLLPIEESGGVAEEVYLWWRPGSRCPEGAEVRVDYWYEVPAGDREQLVETGTLSLATAAANLSLGVLVNRSQVREYSSEQESRTRSELGATVQVGMLDGPFSVSTAMNDREGVDFRSSTIVYRRGGTVASQTVERYDSERWQRRRGITRVSYDFRQGSVLRLQGFAQHLVGRLSGPQEGNERALQTGVDATFFPAPNLNVHGSLSYLKDWAAPEHDQAVVNFRGEWWRGQLSVTFDSELQEDLGWNAARGRFRLLVARQF